MNDHLKCLIVEDDITIVYIIKVELSNYGYEVVETHIENASQMKKAIAEQKFDIIISDHNMPSFSSLEALFIRNEHCRETPFLIYTNDIPKNIEIMAIENGCSMVLKKEDVLLLPKIIEKLTCKTIN